MEKNKKKELIRMLKFTLISISAGVIQTVSFELILLLGAGYWMAYLPSLLLSVLWNFTINRKYTFKAANNVKVAMLLTLAFYAVFTPVSTILGEMATNAAANKELIEQIVFVATLLSNFILEFLYDRFIVYRHACDTAPGKKKQDAPVEEK